MITKLFTRTAPHEHADPAQRVQGIAELPPDSDVLPRLMASDPAPDVRIAAARRCGALAPLAAASVAEADPAVRAAIRAALGEQLAATTDAAHAQALLAAADAGDDLRAVVARQTRDPERRRAALDAIGDEAALVDLALVADHAEARMAAAERVRSAPGLRRLADAAKNRDHGVARLARQRLDAMEDRDAQAGKADAILAELEALPEKPGPILTPVVELTRRWQALDMSADAPRLARYDAARTVLQARFDREQDEQRTRARYEKRQRDWLAELDAPASAAALAALDAPAVAAAIADLRVELAALREAAAAQGDLAAVPKLDAAEQKIASWERQSEAQAGAEALVAEAEQLAAGTSIDNAKLPDRWQALDRTLRTPAMTRRFEAALIVVEQRRLAQVQAAAQESNATRLRVHGLLHAAEQALAAGALQTARAGADEIKALKAGAGLLPKPTQQRISRLVGQLVELERWESFGQQNARVQLCERAEALATQKHDAAALAVEVQKLRAEWKALDAQHAGVPKALWERFDGACEKAYAPAARHFAEQAAQRKEARRQREEFVAAAAAHAATLQAEPQDWRAIERWLRETGDKWRDGDLGSVEPGAWKKLDAKLKTALTPLRDALATARDGAKATREALIAEAQALEARAMERDTLGQVKAIQARWQEQAKALALAQRDERALWERFRAACDAVFNARTEKRKQEDGRKQEGRRALEDIVRQLEALAQAGDRDDAEIKRSLRDLQDQWRKQSTGADSAAPGLESRFRSAKAAVDGALAARTRSRESAVWQTLAAKERLCEELDVLVPTGGDATTVGERWAALPALPGPWEKQLAARRDAALQALADPAAAAAYTRRLEAGAATRSETLLALEMLLGQPSPPELQAQRLALQVKQLRDRFQSAAAATANAPGERLLAWCAAPGVADARDRQRADRLFTAIAQVR